MKNILMILISVLLSSSGTASKQVTYSSQGNMTVYADYYETSVQANTPTIILFHQAGGSAQGEYASIIPRLIEKGYNILAVDLRNGGDRFALSNRTKDHSEKKDYTYCQAYPDVIASLNFIKSKHKTGKVLAWGSSYSAALVIKLAAEYPNDISAFLAFSPASGKPMGDCSPNDLADKVSVKGLIARPDKEMKIPSAKGQFELFKKQGFTMLIAENGVHGSSMLVKERTKHSTENTWNAVLDFLQKQQQVKSE